MQDRSRKSPPQAPSPTESPHLLRELVRARSALLALHAAYIYGDILLRQDLPSVARLLGAAAQSVGGDALALGVLLREQGASHAVNITLRDTPYHLLTDADSHAPVVALRLLKDRIRDEKNGILHAKSLQKQAVSEAVRQALSHQTDAAGDRLTFLEEMAKRLADS